MPKNNLIGILSQQFFLWVMRIIFFLIIAIMILSYPLYSQELVNDSNGKIQNNGTIKFNSSSAKLTNNNSNPISDNKVLNPGTIEFSGSVTNVVFDGSYVIGIDGQRIPGTVAYSSSNGSVTLVGTGDETYYTNLFLSGSSAKTLNDGIFVSGSYSVAGGDRNYLGTFYYDGSNDQILAGENGSAGDVNIYNNLSLLGGGKKTVNSGSDNQVNTLNSLLTESGTTLSVKGTIIIGTASSPSSSSLNGNLVINGDNGASATDASFVIKNTETDFNGNINIRNGGNDDAKFILDGSADANIYSNLQVETTGGIVSLNEGGGDLNINESATLELENNQNSGLVLSDGTELNIYGNFINNYTTDYSNAEYNNSTVYYRHSTNNMEIAPTSASNPYGNIELMGSGKKTASGNIYISGDLSIEGGNLDMYDSGNDFIITITDSESEISYDSNQEIIGKMRRMIDSGNNLYTFNNENTTILFTSSSSTYPDHMTFSVHPDTEPQRYSSETDIKRKITISYPDPPSQFTATIKAQFKDEELYSGSYDQSTLRFMEASTASVPEKLSTGEEIDVTVSSGDNTVGSILLAGIKSGTGDVPNDLDIFASGHDLLMRAGPAAMYAIGHGRWSNPDIWDEGQEPESDDIVIIDGYTVHVGFIRSTDNYETDESYPDQLAKEITIGTSDNSSLLFGSSDISGSIPLFKLSSEGKITNRGLFGDDFPENQTEDTGSNLYEGLIIYQGSSLLVNDLLNDGTLSNGGHLEIGDE